MFLAWVRQPADCEISIDYNSALLNHVSKNGKSCHDESIPIIWVFQLNYNRSNFVLPAHPIFLTRDLVTLNYKAGCIFPMVIVSLLHHAKFGRNHHREDAPHCTLSMSHSPHLLAAGPKRNAKNGYLFRKDLWFFSVWDSFTIWLLIFRTITKIQMTMI